MYIQTERQTNTQNNTERNPKTHTQPTPLTPVTKKQDQHICVPKQHTLIFIQMDTCTEAQSKTQPHNYPLLQMVTKIHTLMKISLKMVVHKHTNTHMPHINALKDIGTQAHSWHSYTVSEM